MCNHHSKPKHNINLDGIEVDIWKIGAATEGKHFTQLHGLQDEKKTAFPLM